MELDEVLRKQVDLLGNGYNIKIYPLEVEKLCNECDAENFKFAILNELGYKQIRVDTLVSNAPFHRASLIDFNVPKGSKWFIVDPRFTELLKDLGEIVAPDINLWGCCEDIEDVSEATVVEEFFERMQILYGQKNAIITEKLSA